MNKLPLLEIDTVQQPGEDIGYHFPTCSYAVMITNLITNYIYKIM